MDFTHSDDDAQVLTGLSEKGTWKAQWTVDKWFSLENQERGLPADETIEVDGNILLNADITALLTLQIGGGGTAFNNANSYLGVGDSSAAEAASQTDLQAATNKLRKVMDSTFPSVAGSVVTFQSTFGSTDANFSWNECGAFNGASGVIMLNRKVITLGTKSSEATWTLKLTITIT